MEYIFLCFNIFLVSVNASHNTTGKYTYSILDKLQNRSSNKKNNISYYVHNSFQNFTHILDSTFPVVIAGGLNVGRNNLDITEVVDVDNNTNCMVGGRISIPLNGASGINSMFCGGEDWNSNILSSCWQLNPNGTWSVAEDMLEPRVDFSLNQVEDEIIAIGGSTTYNVILRSTERLLLTNDAGWSRMNDAPFGVTRHCAVMLNTSYLMIIGGIQNSQVNVTH